MAIEIDIKGLSGVVKRITVDETTDTIADLIALTEAFEDTTGNLIDASYYDRIILNRDPSINSVDSSGTLSSLGIINEDFFYCVLKDDAYRSGYPNIPDNLTGLTKEQRQARKLNIASIKRAGLAEGLQDPPQVYYRPNSTYDLTSLPDLYNSNDGGTTVDESYVQVDDNPNTGGLIPKRPWISVSEIAVPTSIEEAVGGDAIVNLQVWYDAADTTQYVPRAEDEVGITQLKDKSAFAHNANPLGGAGVRPSYEDTDTSLTNGYGYVEFDGVDDNFYINPFEQISEQDTYTIFLAAKLNDASDGQSLCGVNRGGLSVRTAGGVFTTATASLTGTTAVSADTDWHVFALRFDANGATNADISLLLIDGHDKATGANDISSYSGTAGASTGTNDGFYLGARGGGGSDSAGPTAHAAMYLGEVLMFNYALTDIEVKNINNYLANKWGL